MLIVSPFLPGQRGILLWLLHECVSLLISLPTWAARYFVVVAPCAVRLADGGGEILGGEPEAVVAEVG